MGRISFSRTQRADVAVLKRNLELWPVFREIIAGYSVLELETIKTPLNIRDVFRIFRYVMIDKASVGYASMAAQLHRSGVKVLVVVDQTSQVVEALGRLLPDLRQIVIAHGSLRAETSRVHQIRRRRHRVLCVWGESDVSECARADKRPVDCRVIGSLRNASYISQKRIDMHPTTRFPLLFVSQYSGKEEESLTTRSRRVKMLLTVKRFVHHYCLDRGIPLFVALRPPVSAPRSSSQLADEVHHYRSVFAGVPLTFTNPRQSYASYLASDQSDVTVGVPGGTLTESFARGNKILMIRQNPSLGAYYDFPLEGPWLLTEPTYEQFAERLDALRAMRREDCAYSWQAEREYMVAHAESDEPINLVRNLLTRAIRGEAF